MLIYCNDKKLRKDSKNLQTVRYIVEDLLLALSFRNSLCGTNYLCDAIVLCCFANNKKINFCEQVYPVVANMHDTSSLCVNKAIRHAIAVCFDSGDLKKLNDIFHCPLVGNTLPTNAEFILTVALLLRRFIEVDENGSVVAKRISFGSYSTR